LFNAFAVITLLLIIGKLLEQITGELSALSAMIQVFYFAAAFDWTGFTPKRFVYMDAPGTVHFFPVLAPTAKDSSP
jgi:hypothetical protein